MTRSIKFLPLFCAAVLVFASTVARADTFLLNLGGCTGGCGPDSPFATVTLTQFGTGTGSYVQVSEVLGANEVFSQSSGKEALEFNVSGAGTITTTVISDTTDFAADTGSSFTAPPFGTFLDAVKCTTCSGGNGSNAGATTLNPLIFNVSSASGVFISDFYTLSILPPGDTQAYFASDIAYIPPTGGKTLTGDVGSNSGTTSPIPEPSSLLLLGTGIIGAAGLLRRRIV